MKQQQQLSKVTKKLLFEEPFYGLFLSGMHKEFTKSVPTAGVSKHNIGIKLYINPEFFSDLPEPQQKGLIKHEILHISFGHMTMRESYADHNLFNIAADVEINQYISEECLPEGALTLDTFPELNLPQRAGTRKYYELLQQASQNGGSPSLDNLMSGMGSDMHGSWKEFNDLSEAEKKLVQKQVEHQLKETADSVKKSCGSIPGELANVIARLETPEPPKFDWKRYFRRFVGNSSIVYTKKLRRKYNKRYEPNPGLKIKSKNHICVGVDTSGSVSNSELVEFMSELSHMHKTGHKITVVQCDTDIVDISEFDPKKDWNIKGRGGTSFQPVVDHYNSVGKYTALIYLTDGEAYSPENCPKNTLWVHSSRCEINTDLPGLKIQLN